MRNSPVLFLDSGVGGLPYCRSFRELAPAEKVVYLADRANFPYGPRSQAELSALLIALMRAARSLLDPKLVVVACNTASVSALDALRDAFPDLPFVGTVPAVKPAVLQSRKRRIGVIATERTIADPYIFSLARRYGADCRLVGIAAPDLVDFIEHRYLDAEAAERQAAVEPYVRSFREQEVDAIVLGCTHFLFLTAEFARIAAPDLVVYDSVDGVAHRTLAILSERDLLRTRPDTAEPDPGRFLVSGAGGADSTLLAFARLFDLVPEEMA
jgi:glutamate racemase